MSKETRQAHSDRLAVLESVQGHDSTVAHAFNHTNGHCPKCGCDKQMMMFCLPGQSLLPRLRACELDGEHVHRMCSGCSYPWIERPLDQLLLSQEKGQMAAESEQAAALAAFADRSGGLSLSRAIIAKYRGWILTFHRDQEHGTLEITAAPPEPQTGAPAHPDPPSSEGTPQ